MFKLKLWLWRAFEYLFKLLYGIREIRPGAEDMFLVTTRRYHGSGFIVQGVQVGRGSKVMEIHVNNELLMRILREESHSLVAVSVKLLLRTKETLPALAAYVSDPRYEKIDAIYGVSMIHRGISRLGFETFPLKDGIFKRLTTWHLKRLYRVVNPQATELMAQRKEDFVPKVVAMSKAELLRRYLQSAESPLPHELIPRPVETTHAEV